MAFYLVKFDGGMYANDELCIAAIAGGDRAFAKMIASKDVVGKKLFDQTLYLLTDEQVKKCSDYSPKTQDFEHFFKHLNILSADTLNLIKKADSFLPNAALIKINPEIISEQYKYRQASFFKVSDFRDENKYRMLAKVAAVKICGSLYVALNAVDVRIESPIIVTIKN